MPSGETPQFRIEMACERFGRAEVIRRCLALLAGGSDDPRFIVMLGGPHAMDLIGAGTPAQSYWLRVWAARGLLWAGPGDDIDVLRAALTDDSWRVREMTCKVAARYRLGDLLDDISALESDSVPRVRAAAIRAVTLIVEARA